MKIAFILSGGSIAPTNGIISQAKTWQRGLNQLGHDVILIDMWEPNDWPSFDAILYFGFNNFMSSHIYGLSKINKNIYVAPILDPTYSTRRLWLYAHWGITKLNLTNAYHSLNTVKHLIKGFLVRSEFEKKYIVKGFGVNDATCHIVPLSFDMPQMNIDNKVRKEDFCLHISLLTDERKNVKRLIEAAKKYQFRLVLGGKIRNQAEHDLLHSWIGGSEYIELRGFLSDKDKIDLYSRAKVFALPSTNEGVGIVALEAAALGCDIVITSLGGPKEYYGNLAEIVDPYSVDQIGQAVQKLMCEKSYQPDLQKYIKREYNLNSISKRLELIFSR